jgi:RNA polymerase sigma factor (sigma-70 family)
MAEQSLHVQKTFRETDPNPVVQPETTPVESQVWIDFLQGDDKALASLYHQYANKLFNYGRQFTPDKELIADTIQDVFLTLIRTRSKLSVATSVKFYLYAAFRRSLVRQLKHNSKFIIPEDMEDESFQISINAEYLSVNPNLNNDQKKIVLHFCNKLPARQREALVLHYFEDLNYAEIAKTMKLSTSKSARTMVYRALDSLSQLLSTWKKELTIFISFLSFFS